MQFVSQSQIKMMNLYKLTQSVNNGWDTYDSVIVSAETIQDAVRIHPNSFDGEVIRWDERNESFFRCGAEYQCSSWAKDIKDVEVELIGVATPDIKEGVVVASFNAG